MCVKEKKRFELIYLLEITINPPPPLLLLAASDHVYKVLDRMAVRGRCPLACGGLRVPVLTP